MKQLCGTCGKVFKSSMSMRKHILAEGHVDAEFELGRKIIRNDPKDAARIVELKQKLKELNAS